MTSSFFDLPDDPGDELLFLADLASESWARLLVYARSVPFEAGDAVVEEGSKERAFYVVQSGALEAIVPRTREGRREHLLIGPGFLFGEVSFFDGKPRSATVKGREPGELLCFSAESFKVMAQREPQVACEFLMELGRLVAIRLRGAEQAIKDAEGRS